MEEPVRLDFFGDTLESIRRFDPETQRTTFEMRTLDLVPMAEFQLTTDTIRLFRTGYVAAFGAAGPDDALYQAVTEGRRFVGMEHWLPLFHQRLDTLFDYLEGTPLALEPLAEEAAHERLAQIADYYEARRQTIDQAGGGAPYKPLPPDPALSCRGAMARAVGQNRARALFAVRSARRRCAIGRGSAPPPRTGHNFAARAPPKPAPTCSMR